MNNQKVFEYDGMNIIIFNDKIKALNFKGTNYLVFNGYYNEFVINRSLYYNNSQALFDKVKKFFRYYLGKTIRNKKDFDLFINECNSFNGKYIKRYDGYTSNGILFF